MIEERPVLLARIESLFGVDYVAFGSLKTRALILDDLQLGIMETSWTESKDKLTRERYKLYAEEGKEDGLNIVFAVCERQELESEETAYGSDYKWGSPKGLYKKS